MFGQYVQWDAGWRPLESVAKRKNNLKSSQMFNNGSILSRLPRVSASQHCRHRVSAPLLSADHVRCDQTSVEADCLGSAAALWHVTSLCEGRWSSNLQMKPDDDDWTAKWVIKPVLLILCLLHLSRLFLTGKCTNQQLTSARPPLCSFL